MARQEDSCWRCGAAWIDREREPVAPSVLPASVSRQRAGTPELLVSTLPTVDAAVLVPA